MLEGYLKNPPEKEKLLAKYRSGNVPPLFTRKGGKDEGLLAEDLLETFRKAFFATYNIPLYISAISKGHADRELGLDREEDLSRQKLSDLLGSCRCFQSFGRIGAGEDTEHEAHDFVLGLSRCKEVEQGLCGCCSEEYVSAVRSGKVRAFMCRIGMISVVAPVRVAGEIVAVLSMECRKPKAGAIWSRSMFGENGSQLSGSNTSSPTTGIDIWETGKRRIQKCEEILGLEPGEILRELTEKVRMDPNMEISPEGLETMMIELERTSERLSDLADKNYRLEKGSLAGWLRAEMASALSTPDDFWDKLRWCFGNLAQFVGVDYILLISRDKSQKVLSGEVGVGRSQRATAGSLHLQCQYGLPQDSLPAIQYDWEGSTTRVDDFVKSVSVDERIQEVDLRQYRDVPVLGMLYSLYGKGVSYPVLVAPATTVDGKLTCMVLGRKEPVERLQMIAQSGSEMEIPHIPEEKEEGDLIEWLREDDREYLMTIVRELSVITNVFFSMRKLQESVDAQTNFMESVSHDLRTPIQNIMTAAENLRECRVSPERASRTITGVVTQLQRLDLLAQKAWMLEQLRLDKLEYDDRQVNLYSVFVECREIMTDMAEMRSMEIHINSDIKNWKPIHVDVEILRLVVLNLLHNSIKYSFPNTHIRIGGWQDSIGIGVAMTFENEGIPVNDEEKDRIFERYFRSNNAVKMSPDGSGVGLALVKEFVDHYKGKIDVRSTEVGFGRYLNVFSIFLPGR